jgi:hypothetical protein
VHDQVSHPSTASPWLCPHLIHAQFVKQPNLPRTRTQSRSLRRPSQRVAHLPPAHRTRTTRSQLHSNLPSLPRPTDRAHPLRSSRSASSSSSTINPPASAPLLAPSSPHPSSTPYPRWKPRTSYSTLPSTRLTPWPSWRLTMDRTPVGLSTSL